MSAEKKIYKDVVIMRLILILLLIIYHSFAPFCGGWEQIGDSFIPVYFYIGKISYSFFLEAFVFISGLLVGYQATKVPIKERGPEFIVKKAKRLMIPSIIFSIIYFYCFYTYKDIYTFCNSIFNGCGHLWFLPMLFWCFVLLWIIGKLNIKPLTIIVIAIAMALLSNGALPLRFGITMFYFIFFLLGYYITSGKLKMLKKCTAVSSTIYLTLFIIFFFINIESDFNGISGFIINHITRLLSSFGGVMLCYTITNRYISDNTKLPDILVVFSNYSFGIYIIQQFILKYLYYYTDLPYEAGYALIPWIGCGAAMISSTLITHFSLKTKAGKFLIG